MADMKMNRQRFAELVKERAGISSVAAAENATQAVFVTLKDALQNEDIEEMITEHLSNSMRTVWEEPKLLKIPEFRDEDVVAEGKEPEEVAIKA